MPILTGPQIITELRSQLKNQSGRHLYAVLGTYHQLELFEEQDLSAAKTAEGKPFPTPVNFNRSLLSEIDDETLQRLVKDESRRPKMVEGQLNRAFERVLKKYYDDHTFLILKQIEMIYAFGLDLSKLRTHAVNQNHLLMLLPGQRVGGQIVLFHEADARFQSIFPGTLIIEANLWEIKP